MNITSSSKPDLRTALDLVTTPPPDAGLDWLRTQITAIEELRGEFAHTGRLHQRYEPDLSELNCFMYALAIEPDAIRAHVARRIFPGADFVLSLVRGEVLKELDAPADGCLITYWHEGRPTHAGIFNNGRVCSKWGAGPTHVWDHDLAEVPARAVLRSPSGL